MNEGAGVLRANALRLPLADESVDLICTSPPFFALRSYRDEGEHYSGQLGSEETPQAFLEALWAVTAECHRVLKPSGSMWVNLGDKYNGAPAGNIKPSGIQQTDANLARSASQIRTSPKRNMYGRPKSLLGLPWRYAIGCIDGEAAPDGQRWILRAEVIWSKPNGLPESVTDRVRRSHEQWFHFVKSPRYFSAVDEVREAPANYERQGGSATYTADGAATHGIGSRSLHQMSVLGKLPGSVWVVPSEPLIIPEAVQRHYDLPDHFAAFPQELPRRIILGWSPNGVCVECGEGRRPVVAKEQRHLATRSVASMAHRSLEPLALTRMCGATTAVDATITGYACACPDASAPTKPSVILDIFGGTGTTAMVARTLGRFGVSVDLSADYNRLARWRIWSSGHGEKAAQRTHKENQGDLFGNAPAYEDVETEAL